MHKHSKSAAQAADGDARPRATPPGRSATISCDPARLLERGWSLTPVPRGTKACFLRDWQRFCGEQPTLADLTGWRRRWPGHGFGFALGPRLLAIDADADAPAEQAVIARLRREHLGETPLVREGRPGRAAALYRLSEPLPGKTKAGPIDLLTGSAQVVAFHVHPDTGRPYRWLEGDPHDIGPAELPVVTPAQVEAFRQAVLQELPHYAPVEAAGTGNPAFGHGTSPFQWRTDTAGLVVDGREEFLSRCILRACLQTRDPRGATDLAWTAFTARADLSRPKASGRPWSRQDAANKVRGTLRRLERGLIAPAATMTPASDGDRPGPHPYFGPGELPADEAKAQLRAEIEAFFADAMRRRGSTVEGGADGEAAAPQLGIAATVGLGKSTVGLEALGKSMVRLEVLARLAGGATVWWFVPRIDLADELAATAQGMGISATVVRGRERDNPAAPGTTMCAKADVAAGLARAGHPVWASLCSREGDDGTQERCEHFAGCPYVDQFAGLEGRLIIMPHDWLRLSKTRLPAPDLMIIDERFFTTLVRETSLPTARIDTPRAPVRAILPAVGRDRGGCLGAGRAAERADEVMADHLARATAVRRALETGDPVGGVVTTAEFRTMARVEHALATASPVTPGQDHRAQAVRVAALVEDECRKRARLFRLLAEDLERGRPSQRVVTRHGILWRGELQDRVFVHDRRKLRLPAVPVLLLDADLDPQIARKVLPGLRVVPIRTRQQAEVIQVTDTTCSKHRLLGRTGAPDELARAGNLRKQIAALLAVEAASGRRVLVVGNKPVLALIETPENGAKVHFNALRGLDCWKHFDTVVVIGREQPPPDAMEAQARSWFGDDDEPLLLTGSYVPQCRGYATCDGARRGATVDVHPDLRIQAILEQSRERETEQAVGRLRLVHRDPARPARVILLSNLPVGLAVDRFVTWNKLMPDRMTQAIVRGKGVLPWSATELARLYPDLWPTARAVHQWRVREGRKGTRTPMSISYWEACTLSEATWVSYRRPGSARGSAHRALLPGKVEDVATAAVLLAAVLGEVEQVQLVEVVERPDPPSRAYRPLVPVEATMIEPGALATTGVIEDDGEPLPALSLEPRPRRPRAITEDVFLVNGHLVETAIGGPPDTRMLGVRIVARPPVSRVPPRTRGESWVINYLPPLGEPGLAEQPAL